MFLWKDYETYYDNDYSLKKMTRTMYLNDPRFKAHGCSFAMDDSDPFWVTGSDLPAFWKDVGPHVTGMCCHNGLFDHGITAKFFMPERKELHDTMSMAQVALMRRFPGLRMSLAALAQKLFPNDPAMHKFEGVLPEFQGVWQLDRAQEGRMADYANQDNFVMREIYRWLMKNSDTPWQRVLRDIHLTLSMGVYPVLEMNTDLAAAVYRSELAAKEKAVVEMNIERSHLRSNPKFAALLLANGMTEAELPTKLNAKGDVTYAFAAKDPDFVRLADHPIANIRALYELRIGEKSAQIMNRSYVFSQLPSPVPVPLVVAAGHTGRHGGDEYNLQNLKRGSDLRRCIRAAKDHKILVGDAKQIELRGNAWFCDETTLTDLWAIDPNYDVYSDLATVIYGRTITKANEDERFNGKTGELACQYGAGEERIAAALETATPPVPREEARRLAPIIKRAYRSKRTKIVAMWKWLNDTAIKAMAGMIPPVEHKGVRFELHRAILPSGRCLWYNNLHVNGKGDWVYDFVDKKGGRCVVFEKKLYGGALLENLIQALCYDIFMFQLDLADQYVAHPAMAVHDEGVFMIHETKVAQAMADLGVIYQCAPAWFRGVPILGEFKYGDTYYDAK
jgi:DNA polymerase